MKIVIQIKFLVVNKLKAKKIYKNIKLQNIHNI